jgi:hypothetical protein
LILKFKTLIIKKPENRNLDPGSQNFDTEHQLGGLGRGARLEEVSAEGKLRV